MRGVRDQVQFLPNRVTYQDGVVSNFEFSGAELARPAWRYPDLGPHLVFMANIISRTITEQMREESQYLRSHAQARSALKEIVELPDQQADRVIRAIEQNRGQLSNALAKEMPVLSEPGVWAAVVDVVSNVFRQGHLAEESARDR